MSKDSLTRTARNVSGEVVEVELVPQPHGGALQRGNPGKKTGGRPPDEWRLACEQAFEDGKGLDVVLGIMSGDILDFLGRDKKTGEPIYGPTKNRDRLGAASWLWEQFMGKAPQKIEVSQSGVGTGADVLARVLEALPGLLSAVPIPEDRRVAIQASLEAQRRVDQAVEAEIAPPDNPGESADAPRAGDPDEA